MHSHRLICCTFTHEDYNIAFRFMFPLSLLFNLGKLGGPGEIGGIIERSKAHAQAMTGSRDFLFCSVHLLCRVCFLGGLHGEGGWFNIQYAGGFGFETRLDSYHRRLAQHSSLQKGRLAGTEDVKKGARPFFFGGGRGQGKAGQGRAG